MARVEGLGFGEDAKANEAKQGYGVRIEQWAKQSCN
jgi:hypothetical protein